MPPEAISISHAYDNLQEEEIVLDDNNSAPVNQLSPVAAVCQSLQ